VSHNSCVELEISGGETIEFSPSEMLEYIRYIQHYSSVKPRTYWCEFPFYIIISGARQIFRLGYRPEDLAHIDTIEKKVWKKHQSYLKRLDRFPLDKAEYYLRIKEAYGINSIRGLAKMIGEDWSCIARILKTLDLSEPIKAFLRENKDDPALVKFFNLRRHLEIVKQGEERFQLARFREYMEEYENSMTVYK